MTTELLTADTVGSYLIAKGLASEPTTASTLSGGVSNVVLAVSSPSGDSVVKQALERLRVDAEWHAPERRIIAEASALKVVRSLDPSTAPAVINVDTERMILVLERAPVGATDWKSALLRGDIDTLVARRLGVITGRLHAATSGGPLPPELENDSEAFEALRLDPYHGAAARALPESAKRLHQVADQLRATRTCLVHGDLSPKNVLVFPRHLWLIDFEVAQRGDPVFDLAFLLTHLMLKSVARPQSAAGYDRAADAFLEEYAHSGPPFDVGWLISQMGALLLARVVGKSPVEYLDHLQQRRVVALGQSALAATMTDLDELRQERDSA